MLANKKSNSDRGGSGGSITGGGGSAIVGGSGAGGAGDSEDGGSSQSSHGTDVEAAEALDGDSLEGGPSARQPQFRYVIQVSRTDWTFQIFAILQGINKGNRTPINARISLLFLIELFSFFFLS